MYEKPLIIEAGSASTLLQGVPNKTDDGDSTGIFMPVMIKNMEEK